MTLLSCDNSSNDSGERITTNSIYVADYSAACENILRKIPKLYVDKAREELHIAYQHTSHGTHVSYGMFGIQDYKAGDNLLFGITNNNPEEGKLDFNDYAMASFAADGDDAADLSRNEVAFIQATRNFLDDQDNASINVVMWSWCDISGHDVETNYLPGMQILINEYGEGGSKIGNGLRTEPVTFVFMTGHANPNSNIGDGRPKDQADIITKFCEQHKYLCLDYYSIDSHDMLGNYWEDASDDGNSGEYGGNFYLDYQESGNLGVNYFENKNAPGGSVVFGQHNTQHITANRKAYAMWWILARIAGWNGVTAK